MRNWIPIGSPPPLIHHHDQIVKAKRSGNAKNTLNALRPLVLRRYRRFKSAIADGSIHAMQSSKGALSAIDLLRSCYDNRTLGVSELVTKIKLAQVARARAWCPYCGIRMSKSTVDHYLPAEVFPELSVNVHNLVPCCNACNEKKGVRWRDGGQRIFLNVYFDALPASKFLFVALRVTPPATALSAIFELRRPLGISNEQWSLVERHFTQLNLIERFEGESPEEISDAIESCCAHLRDGGTSVSTFLADRANESAAAVGDNNWRVVLWQALSASFDFEALVRGAI